MPVTYEQLKNDQKCIYQAFQNVDGNGDAPSAMGKYVNAKGIDADDDQAVYALSVKYGLDQIEMFLGEQWNKGAYNLEKGWEYVLTVNAQKSMISDFKEAVKALIMLKGAASVQAIQKKYPHAVGHAIYCKTKKTDNTIDEWIDIQGIYKQPGNGFPDNVLVVAYGRKRKD